MAKRRIQPSDEEIAQRARDLARQVSGRVFVSEDGVYVVRGMPSFRNLRNCLSNLDRVPDLPEVTSPMDLGFTPDQIACLTPDKLTTWELLPRAVVAGLP